MTIYDLFLWFLMVYYDATTIQLLYPGLGCCTVTAGPGYRSWTGLLLWVGWASQVAQE
jgi:hypothetical protein